MCLFPKRVLKYETIDKLTGEIRSHLLFNFNENNIIYENYKIINLPCRNCIECQIQYSNEWAFRIMSECSLHQENCFITLTYKENPEILIKRDIQLFLKRLRKFLYYHYNKRIRYFLCGEYGAKGKRPHFHLIIFGWFPNDIKFLKKSGDENLYYSKIIDFLWGKGFISVGNVSLHSAKYCAKYLQKSLNMEKFSVKPFVSMSLKPGIGANYILKNKHLVNSDKLYFSGKYIKLPRYYLDLLQKNYYLDLSNLKEKRERNSILLERSEEQLEKKREYYKNLLT